MIKIYIHQGGCVDIERELVPRKCVCGCGKTFRVHPNNKSNRYSSQFCEHKTVVDPEYIKKRPGVTTKALKEIREQWKKKLETAERINKGW